MMTIVLKHSTYSRVMTRLRRYGSDVVFFKLTSRVFHDSGFTYLYFPSFTALCTASDFLSACNAVYRVTELSL